MSYEAERERKLISAEAAEARVRPGDWVDLGGALVQPDCSTRRWRSARMSFAT